MKKIAVLLVRSIENLKTFRYHTLSKSIIFFYYKFQNKDEKIFKEKESIELLKILSLIEII